MSAFYAAANQRTNQWCTLVTEECCKCHILFAMPQDLQQRAINDQSINFYCPKGHPQVYTSDKIKTLEAQLQRSLEEATREAARRREAEQERDHHWIERKKTNTRFKHLKERVKAGVCPCCHRTFQQLAKHMALKHPSFARDEPEVKECE